MRKGAALGLISASTIDRLLQKEKRIGEARLLLDQIRLSPREAAGLLSSSGSEQLRESCTLTQLLKRNGVRLEEILMLPSASTDERLLVLRNDPESRERVQIEVKYDGYLKRQDEEIRNFESHEQVTIPHSFDFGALRALSNEGREKLLKVRPRSVGQASRIGGVTVADLSVLLVHLRR
jgi:tRNA uridine 5-carboxymethylaminomethyl modification enzyme